MHNQVLSVYRGVVTFKKKIDSLHPHQSIRWITIYGLNTFQHW